MRAGCKRGNSFAAVSCLLAVTFGCVASPTPPVGPRIDLGPRPHFLVAGMAESELKDRLARCSDGPFYPTDFSIGHRGAPLQFPEHTRESYEAAARMGAGRLECDVTFTRDRELVCRHSQCDLHTTTNILEIPELAAKCSSPFTAYDAATGTPAGARCCTSDITLAEFRRLRGRMDASNPKASNVEEYLSGTRDWRAHLYESRGTLMTHAESIALFRELGVKFIPELKAPMVPMPFDSDYTRKRYAQQLIDEYRNAGINPSEVYVQSFHLEDVLYWIENEPEFGRQAVFLEGRDAGPGFDPTDPKTVRESMTDLYRSGVRIIAPPIWMLVVESEEGAIVPSVYAIEARRAGLDIVAWTFERSDLRAGAGGDDPTWYYQTVGHAVRTDSDMLEVLHVLAKDVGIIGIFSDWPATVTYYASCMELVR